MSPKTTNILTAHLPSTPPRPRVAPSIAVFSPRAPMQRSKSPRVHVTTSTRNTVLPMGFDLIVRGVGADKKSSDPVKILLDAVETLKKEDEQLSEIPLIVKPFSTRGDWVPTVYVHLDSKALARNVSEVVCDNEPRTDLLQCWKEALQAFDPTWEVKWAPLTHGKDKRPWIRFAQLKPEDSKDAGYQEKCKTHLLAWAKQKGYPVTNSYFNAGGVTLCMASPAHVDEILARGTIEKVPGIQRSLQPVRGRQIEIENAFELAIAGLTDDYDQDHLHDMLREWIMDNFTLDDSTSLAGARVDPAEPEIFIFHMTTWKATRDVLQPSSVERFKEDFKAYESLQPPQLLYNLNTSGLGRRPGSVRKDLVQGASSVVDGLDKLRREFLVYKETNDQQHQATRLQLSENTASVTSLRNSVADLGNRLADTQRAVLFQAHGLAINKTLLDIKSNASSLRVNLLIENDEGKRQQLQLALAALEKDEIELRAQLSKTDVDFRSLVQGAQVGQLISNGPASSVQADVVMPCDSSNTSGARRAPMDDHEREYTSKKRRLNQAANPSVPDTHAAGRSDAEVSHVIDEVRHVSTDEVRNFARLTTGKLIAADDGVPDSSMKRTPRYMPRSACKFRGVFDTLRDLNHVHHRSRTFSCRSSLNPGRSLLLVLLILLANLACSACAAHTNPASTLSIYALNVNGLVQPVKLHTVATVIKAHSPHAFVLGETKTKARMRDSLPYDAYDIYEEPGEQDEPHHPVKWGLVVGVRKDIQIARRLDIEQRSLKGRVIAIDLVLPPVNGRCASHCLIGTYAPWNPGDAGVSQSFWADLTDLCNSVSHPWTVAGDLNSTISAAERLSGGLVARAQYLKFLDDTDAVDLWANYPERSRRFDWTVMGHSASAPLEGNIIDRVATSRLTLMDSEIYVAGRYCDWIPHTDHRAIVACVSHALPVSNPSRTRNTTSDGNFFRQHSNKRRIKFPSKADGHGKYDLFAEAVDDAIRSHHLHEITVTDDVSFLQLYNGLSSAIATNAAKAFGRSKQYFKSRESISNATIRSIVAAIRHVGGAIHFEKSNRVAQVSLKARMEHCSALRASSDSLNVLTFLTNRRRSLHKALFSERSKEIFARARRADKCKIIYALKGTSTKRLVHGSDYVPLPLVVNDLDNPMELVCDPDGVKATTMEYFRRLYDHSRIPALPKPWMETPSVIDVRTRVSKDPFVWPREANLPDLRALLRKGNNRPSPGPDQWEKWAIKSLSDFALSLVLRLLNYQILNSRFPGDIKDMWLTMFHKRNLRTDLQNWRGLLISNLIANLPMAWLNSCLIRYSAEKQILPDTQVAAQPGVQTRDLMSFLSGIKCWAFRHKQVVYAIKRDQMKGFDYLSPDGFYDAVRAYGLPESVIDLDRASQTDTRCFIRTAYGITNPITISGVNKQGGPASPLKSVFTTSLGSYYLQDLLRNDVDALTVSTSSAERNDPHVAGADVKLMIGMVEATDDSFIFSKSLPSLIRNTLAMERFQYAYGWLTQWTKSTAYVLGGQSDHPDYVSFHSVSTAPGTDPMSVTEHKVALVSDNLEFLRTRVNNAASRFDELKSFIEAFRIPLIVGRLPITLIRKIISQNVVSRCRALISLQPLRQSDAETLDKMIIRKVHNALGFPFQPSTDLATLPISYHGFGFPSIARINASLAVEGIMRDLNHHLPAYRTMARITLYDWMCEKSDCAYPLDGNGLVKNFSRLDHSIPSAWLTAHRILKTLGLSLRETDQSHIAQGDVSLAHVIRSCNHNVAQPSEDINGTTLRSLRLKGLRTLADVGQWMVDCHGNVTAHLQQRNNDASWSAAALRNWAKVYNIVHHNLRLDDVVSGPLDLAVPRDVRRTLAERLISSLANVCKFSRSRYADTSTWASDGSMIPPSAGILDPKQVVGAATGKRTLALKAPGTNVSILQGELVGMILALVLSQVTGSTSDREVEHRVLTDHLNSVRLIDDSKTGIDHTPRLRYMNGRSYYRWILDLTKRVMSHVVYTPGHSTELTLEANLNNEADFIATNSQNFFRDLPLMPIPTFYMNDYTFYSASDGWIESNISSYVDALMARCSAEHMRQVSPLRFSTWAHDKRHPPDYPYARAASAHSAAVQLYARSGQLATADLLFTRGMLMDNKCRLGCDAKEDMRHIFVNCVTYKKWRDEAQVQIVEKTALKLDTMKLEGNARDIVVSAAESLFSDNPLVWPLHLTMFYLGQIPDLDMLIPADHGLSTIMLMRLKTHISSDWHTSSIRLAGRIFGDYQRRMAVLNALPKPIYPSSRTYVSTRRQ